MKLLVLLSVCSCLALNAWTQPRPCVSPPWITGGISMSMKDGAKTSSGMFTYDGWGQQVRFRNFETEHSTTHFTDLLMNFKQKVIYEIDHASQTCKKKSLETSFHPMQVPPDSLFFGQAIMGTTSIPAGGLLVNNWVGEVSEIKAQYMLIFSEYTCLPITAMVHRPGLGWTAISFFNQVLTVLDPSDFTPPAFCQNAVFEGTENTDFIKAIHSVIEQNI
ncbi:ependymin-2 isoform X1 [Astyanax mexicanus]|uniref:Ependymin-2-like n=1 Tax=Astyanax mexicanus TaxID=7994 RepID=W5LQQ8_ASTMX|nr:ependymin-2 isoform X1 [Astyanax mexicanus]